MVKNASSPRIPELLPLGTPASPSTAMRDFYQKERDFAFRTFDPEQHPEILTIPEKPQEFLRLLEETRDVQRILVHEALTNQSELAKRGHKVHGKKLHAHQRGHAFHAAVNFGSGKKAPSSQLIRGAPGTGKTLELGQWMQSGIHAQIRGTLPKGIIGYFTQRPFHLVQQTQGLGMTRRRLVRTPPFEISDREIATLSKEFKKLHPDLAAHIPSDIWNALFGQTHKTEAEARSAFQRQLHGIGKLEKARAIPDFEVKEAELLKLLLGNATIVNDIDQTPTMIDLPEIDHTEQITTSFGGDAAFALPKDYPVLAKERWGMNTKDDERKPRVLLMPAAALTSAVQREKLAEILKNLSLILLDEAGNWHASVFENPVLAAGGKRPVVIAATATDQGKDWGARLAEHSVSRSVEDQVLPDVGIDVFPGQNETHFPRDTMQAVSQLVEHHFKDLPLLARLKLPQPYEGNSLVVVHGSATRTCAESLQAEYDKKKTGGKVLCLDGKTPQADREKLLLWMAGAGDGPKVIVGNPTALATALDLPHVHNVTVGTTITPTLMKQILGRALHSAHERVIFRQQQFADSNLSTTPFAQLEHNVPLPDEDGFTWVPGQALMSSMAYKKDKAIAKKSPEIKGREVPPPSSSKAKNADVIAVGTGTQASDFTQKDVKDALMQSPLSGGYLSRLADAYRSAGNTELGSIVQNYGATLSMFILQNASKTDFRALFCGEIIRLRDKVRERAANRKDD